MENEVWRWIWTFLAVTFALAEVFTAAFFLLPFAIGAAAAAVLGWLDVGILWQWLAFFVLSALSFVYLRRFVRRQNQVEQPRVGAFRLIDAQGKVIERVDNDAMTGMVQISGEQWRAVASEIIEVDSKVQVAQIDGTRLVVQPVTSTNPSKINPSKTES
ncbi:MAG: NfeD family protein [Acidimicrobiia bacterium]|nr:NfeD family protein [Acidimicrobiia bacterium]MYC57649.1 NfeD family protein [Acidimicrobiia bacterium]MYI31229.1 NfeD family protein [Acidimicrobiia bacterium]